MYPPPAWRARSCWQASHFSERPHMRHAGRTYARGIVAALERAHDAAATPLFGSAHQLFGERHEIRDLHGETAKRIALQGVEARGDHDEIRLEALGRGIDGAPQ